ALSPSQLAHRLGGTSAQSERLACILFPQVDAGVATWTLEAMTPAEVGQSIESNLYGAANGARPPTVFEKYAGGLHAVAAGLTAQIAAAAAGYRLRLGRDAYAGAALGQRLRQLSS